MDEENGLKELNEILKENLSGIQEEMLKLRQRIESIEKLLKNMAE